MKKKFKIIYLVIFFLFVLFIFSNNTKADEIELKNISFNDSNLYYALKEKFASSITSFNDETLTISIYSNMLDTIKNIRLSNEGITDLTGIENFQKLDNLYLNGCKIKKISCIPYENLTTLSISHVEEIEDFSNISNFKKMYSLEISDSNLTKVPEQIYELNDTLHKLTIKNSMIEDLSGLSNLNNLTELDITGNKITDITPLSNLTKLTNLTISNNKVEDISSLSNLNLHIFKANDNEISDISALKNMSITYLGLKNNNIKDISCINMNKIKDLDLSYNSIEDFSNITVNNTEYKLNNQIININVSNAEDVQLPNIINQAITNFEAKKIEVDNCTVSEDYKECNIETDADYAKIKIVGGRMDNTIIYLNCDSENMGTLTGGKNNNNLNMYMMYIIIGCIALMCILIIIYIIKHKKAKNMEV